MGAAASKFSRVPASQISQVKPSWAGVRAGEPVVPARPPLASATRNPAIDSDAKDPHLLANLSRLGQVTIQSHETAGTSERISRAYAQQVLSEGQAALTQPPRNKLRAGELALLFDELRNMRTQLEVNELAARYQLDLEVLQRLVAVANSPSVGPTVKTIVDGEERLAMTAVWLRQPKEDVPLRLSPK